MMEEINMEKVLSYRQMVWRQFKVSWLNRLGLCIVILLALMALSAPFLANGRPLLLRHEGSTYFPVLQNLWPFSYLKLYPQIDDDTWQTMMEETGWAYFAPVPYSPGDYDLDASLLAPSSAHWLGTDEQGRDILSRMIHGSRISLSVGFVAVSIYTLIGVFFGALAGYFGGKMDWILSRVIEVMICFPTFFLIITIITLVGGSIYNIMIVIGLTGWTGIARLIRGEFLKLRHQDFIVACRAQGMGVFRIMRKHLLPNALAPVFVSATFGVASAILVESSLSFIGFGVQPPTPSWGDILSQASDFIDIAWWLTLFPGIAIFLTITAFNLVGEGLRDAIDPKLKSVE